MDSALFTLNSGDSTDSKDWKDSFHFSPVLDKFVTIRHLVLICAGPNMIFKPSDWLRGFARYLTFFTRSGLFSFEIAHYYLQKRVTTSVAIFADFSETGRFFTLAADRNFEFQMTDFWFKNP